MTSCGSEILDNAICRRLSGGLAAVGVEAPAWQVRFLAADPEQDGVWVEPLDETDDMLDALACEGTPVQVTLGFEHGRYAFRSRILRRNKHFWLTETSMREALFLEGPIEFFDAERRIHPRIPVPDANNIFAQITTSASAFPLRVRPWDISAGGISCLCPRDPTSLKLKCGDSMHFILSYRGRTIAGDAEVRFSRMITERVIKIGAQFTADSMDEMSREHLKYFLAEMSRLARPRASLLR